MILPPRDIWQCLETFFIITIEGGCYWPRNVEQGIEKDIEQDIPYPHNKELSDPKCQ